MSNLEKTTKEGFFHSSFNDKEDAAYLLANLNKVLGTPEGTFYFERVALNSGNKQVIQRKPVGESLQAFFYCTELIGALGLRKYLCYLRSFCYN